MIIIRLATEQAENLNSSSLENRYNLPHEYIFVFSGNDPEHSTYFQRYLEFKRFKNTNNVGKNIKQAKKSLLSK